MPVDGVRQAVDVLAKLPAKAALADAGYAAHRDETCLLLAGGGVKELLYEAQLLVSSDEGGLQAFCATDASSLGDDPFRTPGTDRLLLALQVELPELAEGDRPGRRAPGGLVDEHRAWRGDALDPGGGIDRVADHHAL